MGEFIAEAKHSDGKVKTYFKQTRNKTGIEKFTKDKVGKIVKLKEGEKPIKFDNKGVEVL